MCYHSKQTADAQTLETRFDAKVVTDASISSTYYNGFSYPNTPVITNTDQKLIQLYSWGLLPSWSKDQSFRKNLLNAKIETINELASFKNNVKNRCLILADGFFEWQWLDTAGKKKQKYLLELQNGEPFAFAGIYSPWTDKSTGEIINSYSIVTTEANKLMAEIHNNKKRMPVILTKENEKLWLAGNATDQFALPEIDLKATAI